MGNFIDFARSLTAAGISHMPTKFGEKRPLLDWKSFQNKLPTDEQCTTWYGNADRIGIFSGVFSRRFAFDFDYKSESWCLFKEKCIEANLDIMKLPLYIERSQSGGRHVICNSNECFKNEEYTFINLFVNRDECSLSTNRKKPILIWKHFDKEIPVLEFSDGRLLARYNTIETRGNGGYLVISPSTGYEVEYGDICNLEPIDKSILIKLIEIARSCSVGEELFQQFKIDRLNQRRTRPKTNYQSGSSTWHGKHTAQDFAERGREILISALEDFGFTWNGFNNGKNADGETFTRPGKSDGTSASLFYSNVFHVFTNGAPPFQKDESYSPLETYAILKHKGNQSLAAKELFQLGFGDRQFIQGSVIPPPSPEPINIDFNLPEVTNNVKTEVKVDSETAQINAIIESYTIHVNEETVVPDRAPDIWDCEIGRQEKCLLVGASKTRKSWFLSNLVIHAAMGLPFLERPMDKVRIIVYDMELKQETLLRRYRSIFNKLGIKPFCKEFTDNVRLKCTKGKPRLLLDKYCAAMIKEINDFGADLVVLDPVYKFLNLESRSLDENSATDMALLLSYMDSIQGQTKSSLLLCTHCSKGVAEEKQLLDRASGSGVFARDCDAFLSICKHKEAGKFVLETMLRDNKEKPHIGYEVDHPVFRVLKDLDCSQLFTEKKEKNKFVKMEELVPKLEINRNYTSKELQELIIKEFGTPVRTADIVVKTLAKQSDNLILTNIDVDRAVNNRILNIRRTS